jgi:hypothetical protein
VQVRRILQCDCVVTMRPNSEMPGYCNSTSARGALEQIVELTVHIAGAGQADIDAPMDAGSQVIAFTLSMLPFDLGPRCVHVPM